MLKGEIIRLFLISVLSVFLVLTVPTKGLAVVDEYEDKVELRFKGEDKQPKKPSVVNPDNNYKPSEPQKINRLLPQTGETILSFMFILIGLSITLLIVGIMTMRRVVGELVF